MVSDALRAFGDLARYPLQPDGAILHWLACGPVTSPLADLAAVIPPDGSPFGPGRRWAISNAPDSLELKAKVHAALRTDRWLPAAAPSLQGPGPRGRGNWRYVRAEEDSVIDFGLFNYAPARMESWLFAYLLAEQSQTIPAEVLTVGPVQLWLNGQRQLDETRFGYVELLRAPLSLSLSPGWNPLWLYGQMIGWREARLALGLRLLQPAQVEIGLPLGSVPAERWRQAEAELSRLVLKQFAFPRLPAQIKLDRERTQPLEVMAEVSLPDPAEGVTISLDRQEPRDRPVETARLTLQPGQPADLPISPAMTRHLSHLPLEHYLQVTLRPTDGTPFALRREIWAGQNDFRQQPYGDYDRRRREALEHLVRMPQQVMGAMAALETGRAGQIEPEAIYVACQFLENRYDCADFYAITLLALLYTYPDGSVLRPVDRQRIEEAFRHFKFWIDEPGLDAMCFHTENHQILFHVTAYLAGQRWPDQVFSNSGQTGRWQQERARRRIAEWILRRLRGGFSEWDSNSYLSLDAFAMLALVEFADSPRLREMATALLHKIFFMLACQSWRGSHGCTHGRAYVASLKTARVENTSGMQRIAWGLGGFNSETRATGLLALARRYRVPEIIQEIGADMPDRLVTRTLSSGQYRPQFDLQSGAWQANTLTYRAPDGMLSAAVDHRPGAVGIQEHLWQATLSPEATVFTTQPGNSQENEVARPNFWAGSARLPRVAMLERTVICLYNLALGRGLPFSHAYFPAAAFDEYFISGPWAFGRVGQGYVALWGDGPLKLTTSGQHAGQELRSGGSGLAWLACLGRAAIDGDFARFCRTLSQNSPEAEGSSLRWTTPEGRRLSFGWSEPFLVDGRPQALNDWPHYDNIYTHTPPGAEQMVISHNRRQMVLDLARGRVLS